jgi:hypothetical protein
MGPGNPRRSTKVATDRDSEQFASLVWAGSFLGVLGLIAGAAIWILGQILKGLHRSRISGGPRRVG